MPFIFGFLLGWALPSAFASDLINIERDCAFELSPVAKHTREVLADFVKLPSGQELFVRIEKPRTRPVKGWYFLVHGLLESHRSYDEVAHGLLERGFGVVRMDLRGFARSLHREIQNWENERRYYSPPMHLEFTKHVQDLIELLEVLDSHYGIRRPHLVGHSMGGGLTLALLADERGQRLSGPRATVIAPYIYRLDYYLAEKFTTLGLPIPSPILAMDRLLPNMAKLAPEFFVDMLFSDRHMRHVLGSYFDNVILTRELKIPYRRMAQVRRHHIESALASVKGMRGFNALLAIEDIPAHIEVDLIYGDEDPVVERRQARQLGAVIERRGGAALELQAGHMLLSEVPELLVEHIAR